MFSKQFAKFIARASKHQSLNEEIFSILNRYLKKENESFQYFHPPTAKSSSDSKSTE